MGRLRNWVNRLERATGGGIVRVPLEDGTTAAVSKDVAFKEMFEHFNAALSAVHRGEARPEPPEVLSVVARAHNRKAAYRALFGDGAPFLLLDEEALLERGELVPRQVSTDEDLSLSR
jgi:hypothetical protein